ncbi:MAG TPA: PAS domain-containing sensor histidine kinase, partial [Candidatus Lokiarchaeia archaeon]
NESLCDLLGYSSEELMGMNYKSYMSEESSERTYKVFNDVFRTNNPCKNFEYEFIKKNREKIFVEISVYLKIDSENHKIGFYGLVRDITEKKREELLKEKFKEQLEKEVKLRTQELQDVLEQQKKYLDQIIKSSQFKTEFMATMSHELRTPLNSIIGFTELLLEGSYGPLNKDQINFLQDVKSSAEHQFEMIYQILDISKIESGQITLNLKTFLLNDLINQIVSTVKPLYTQKGLKFKIIGLDLPKKIVADSVRLKEIIYNLLTNAIKFTIKGRIKLIINEDEENWIFLIKDTGIGIDKKDYDLIFKDFKRVDSPYVNSVPGTGLGLALTRRLVQLHNGKIWFESELGKGSTFFFTIPKIST